MHKMKTAEVFAAEEQYRENRPSSTAYKSMIDRKRDRISSDKRTSVGGLIREKTFLAFMRRPTAKKLNDKESKAIKTSSIIAFNNDFL